MFRKGQARAAIPDEIKYADLRWRIDSLARTGWSTEESQQHVLQLDKRRLGGLGRKEILRVYLEHINRIAPGLQVPIRIPDVDSGYEANTGGTFGSKGGWATMTISTALNGNQKAIRAVLAHEVCHYVLNCSAIREEDPEWNEKLTDLCMFVLGLGEIFLDGYKTEVAKESYRVGHRLGYLSEREYRFADQYLKQIRSNVRLLLESRIAALRSKIAVRVGDDRVIDRLIARERLRAPHKDEIDLYEAAYESLSRGRT